MKKAAIVTGASRGIGYAIAQRLGRDGFGVAIMDVNDPEQYRENFDRLTQQGIEWIYVRGDICNATDRMELIQKTVERFGGIQVLVNNAGVAPRVRADLLEMTEESFDWVLGINTKGNMFLTQAVAKQMMKQPMQGKRRGSIINVSSCSAVVSSTGRGEYCVSKAGVSMLTTLYADRLAREGILVNEVRPGVIATDMTATVKEKYDKLFEGNEFPLARWGTAEDIAEAVAIFAGDALPYTTGDYINVDGGFHIRRL